MPFVSLEQVKGHLRILGDDENRELELYRNAAEHAAMQFIGRNVYDNAADLPQASEVETAPEPLLANDDIRAAVLLTVGYLYRNREDTLTAVSAPLAMGSRWLLLPYRIGMGV